MSSERNAPCPCGSGRKQKKCCANRLRRLIVCTPCRTAPRPEYLQALQRDSMRFDILHLLEIGRPVVDARNALAARALEAATAGDYIAWIDDDAWWPRGTLERIVNALDARSEVDIIAGYHGGRDHFCPPFAWRTFDDEASMVDAGRNCPRGALVQIEKTGFHFIVMRRSALERVGPAPFTLLSHEIGEDYTFMLRALGARLQTYVDTGAFIAHVGDDGRAHVVGAPSGRIVNGELILPKTFERPTGPRNLAPVRAYGLPGDGTQRDHQTLTEVQS